MDFYDTTFYDNASTGYSDKRYKGQTLSYIQYFFKRRLFLLERGLRKFVEGKENMTLLEGGCADGIIIDTLVRDFPNTFSKCVGTDISPGMIESAKAKNRHSNVTYFLKNTEEKGLFDVVLGIGFLTPSIFDTEFAYIEKHLKSDGIFVISLASKDSLYSQLKLRDKDYKNDYWDHAQYEKYLRQRYEIVSAEPCGLFIPKLWKIPSLARILQPIFAKMFQYGFSGLFHEKLYFLKKKS